LYTISAVGSAARLVAEIERKRQANTLTASERLLNGALSALRKDPCALPHCTRLRGPGYSHFCRHEIARSTRRVVFAFGPRAQEITVLVIGRHDETPEQVYRALAMLLGIEFSEGFSEAKERCCQSGMPRWITLKEKRELRRQPAGRSLRKTR
jgi:hypothetical protein